MFLEQRQEFRLKGHLAIVLLLALDLLNGLVQEGHTNTEGPIFHLPTEELLLRECLMHPFGGATFNELQSFGNGKSRGQRQQDVNMVWHAADFNGLHSILPGDAAQKWPEPLAQSRRDEGPAFFGAKDAVVVGADV